MKIKVYSHMTSKKEITQEFERFCNYIYNVLETEFNEIVDSLGLTDTEKKL